jgi:ABC-type nitrate/sulfonate/bicarbonate transport system substrate-binding protein
MSYPMADTGIAGYLSSSPRGADGMIGKRRDQMDKLTVGMVAPAFVYFPIWVAAERGFFESRGIECAIRVAGTTDGTTAALEKGDTQFAMVTPEGVIGNAAKGGRLRLVAGNSNRPPLSLIGGKDQGIERIEHLRGKRIGTSSLKEGTAVMVQKMLAAHGLHYPRDYEFAIVGAHPQRWEHLQAGTIDAGLQLVPYNYLAEDAGYPNLGEASDYIPNYAFTAIAFNLDWSEPNRGLAMRVLDALREAIEWTFENRDEAARIIATANKSKADYARRALLEMLEGEITPRDLRIGKKALDAVFETMREVGLAGKDTPLSYGMCVDDSYLGQI